MVQDSEASFRQRLALGFLEEAKQDLELERWRSCVDNSQLATENAAKAALALLGPVGRTHQPAILLRGALDEERFPANIAADVADLTELAELLGSDLHVQSDYGDEATGRTPWELFEQGDAQRCYGWAEQAVRLLERAIQGHSS